MKYLFLLLFSSHLWATTYDFTSLKAEQNLYQQNRYYFSQKRLLTVLNQLPSLLQDCLTTAHCSQDAQRLTVLNKISQNLIQKGLPTLYFLSPSHTGLQFEPQITPSQLQELKNQGFDIDQLSFDLNPNATHRAAITLNAPSAILINNQALEVFQYPTQDILASITEHEALLSILIHELAHHLGYPDTEDHFLDLVGADLAQYLAQIKFHKKSSFRPYDYKIDKGPPFLVQEPLSYIELVSYTYKKNNSDQLYLELTDRFMTIDLMPAIESALPFDQHNSLIKKAHSLNVQMSDSGFKVTGVLVTETDEFDFEISFLCDFTIRYDVDRSKTFRDYGYLLWVYQNEPVDVSLQSKSDSISSRYIKIDKIQTPTDHLFENAELEIQVRVNKTTTQDETQYQLILSSYFETKILDVIEVQDQQTHHNLIFKIKFTQQLLSQTYLIQELIVTNSQNQKYSVKPQMKYKILHTGTRIHKPVQSFVRKYVSDNEFYISLEDYNRFDRHDILDFVPKASAPGNLFYNLELKYPELEL